MEEKAKRVIIYIDVEDEITDVVNKIKESEEKIIALVPPKGIGILRSAINLRILARTSQKIGKQIVIVSNNQSLRAMAGAAEIPVAKTLQSKPEIPEIEALEIDGEDVIDGEKLPVSEFAGKKKNLEDEEAEILSTIDIDDNKTFSKAEPEAANSSRKKSVVAKVPDFNKFRKKLFVFGGLGVTLLMLFIWAIFIAPAAKVIVSARTSDVDISDSVNLISGQSSDPSKGNLALATQTIEKSSEVSFEATGVKEEGEAASGKLTLSYSRRRAPLTVPAGTAFSAGSCNFVTTSSVTLTPDVDLDFNRIPGTGTVGIRSTQIGEQCNLSPQKYVSSIADVSASGGQLSGGSKTTKKVVSEKDVAEAKAKLAEVNVDEIKNELNSKFDNTFVVIPESFSAQVGEAESSPLVGSEAQNGKATLKATSKYTLNAISKADIENYLKVAIENKTESFGDKKIYETGISSVKLTDYRADGQSSTIKVQSTAKIGPKIDENELKKQIFGKKFSDVRNIFEKINGVRDVEVKFSYFWVNTIPSDEKKVDIEFTVKE